MRSALNLCLLITVLICAVLCDHHGNGGHGKKDNHHNSNHNHHHHGGKGHDHKHHASDNMTCHKIASANSDFAFKVFQQAAAAGESHNIFFSPVSISTAFAMLSLGAKGETLNQLIDGLGFNLTEISLEDIHEGFHHLIHMLNDPDSELQLSMGNALFIHQDLKILQTFLDDVKNKYASDAFSTNFQNNEEAKKQINDYVEKQTHGKIVELLSSVDQNTVMVLINYIFFRGKWEKPFEVEMTQEDDFHVNENTTVKVPMMYRSGMYNKFFDRELSCTIVKVPYKGGASALFILPDEGKMKQLEDAFSRPTIMKWVQSLKRGSADLYLPRFSISGTLNLKDMLQNLGVTEVFSDQADLSGITGEPNLKVSKAVHKAVLSIDEKGTEAAGATAIEMMPMSVPPTIKFNRAFMISIYDKKSRSMLYMGKIVNPNAQ